MLFGRQLLKVISWDDMTKDTLVKRFTCPDRYAIMKGSNLVVRESQMAILVNEGKFADVFLPGTYKLDDLKNIPILSGLYNWKYGFETRWKAEIYFVNTVQFNNQKWGTQNPIMMRDKDFGMIRLRGYGIYSFRVKDIKKVILELAGTKELTVTGDVTDHIKRSIVSKLSDAISQSGIPALDLAGKYDELSEYALQVLGEDFANFGLDLVSFYIENLSLPEEVEKMMDTRTNMGIIGDKMGTFTQFQSAQAIRDAAKNPSGGLAGAGVGLGAGLNLGKMMTNAMDNAVDKPNETSVSCPKCNAKVSKGVKFCPECGEPMQKLCPKCGKPVGEEKFCPECGERLVKSCPKCGAEISGNAKFCPECGAKIR